MTRQEQAKRWLSLIYPENENIDINPIYLKEYTRDEILESFSHFRNYMISVYTEIAEGRINFPSPLHCILAVMSAMANSGTLNDNILLVDIRAFKERLKKPKKADKDAVINLLKDTGFFFDRDIFSSREQYCSIEFPDNNLVLIGMNLYCTTLDYGINQGMMYYGYLQLVYMLLNPRLFENTSETKIKFILEDLLRFIDSDEEKETVRIFHEKMLEYGYNFGFNVDISGSGLVEGDVGICYSIDKPTAIVGVQVNDRKVGIGLKINEMRTNTSKYNDYIEKCSDDFKYSLNNLYPDCFESRCEQVYTHQCNYCMEYTLNGSHYRKCTCINWGCPQNHKVFKANKNDIDTYLYFVRENDKKKKAVK